MLIALKTCFFEMNLLYNCKKLINFYKLFKIKAYLYIY